MLLTLASRLLGIVKAKVIGSVFGSGEVADVINFTYNIPNNFRKLFAEGAMSSAYIPVFSRQIGEGKRKDANNLLNVLFTWQLIFFVVLVVLAVCTGDSFIAAISDFGSDGAALGGKLLPFFFAFLGEISIATIYNSMLQCHKRFFAASFSPLLFSLVVIFGIWYGRTPMSMALSVAVGGFAQLLYSAMQVRRLGYRLHVSLRPDQGSFPIVIRRWMIVTYASVIQIISQQVSYSFASMLPPGSVTAFSNATIFWQTPYGIFFTAIATVFFPLMSQSWAKGDVTTLARTTGVGMEYLATFMIPSAIIIGTLSQEFVSSILQGGAFTMEIAMLTSRVVRTFLWGMLFIAWYGFLQKLCYSIDRYRLVLALTAVQSGIDIALSYLFIRSGYGAPALAAAGNIAFLVVLVILLYEMRDVYRIMKDLRLWKALGKILAANIPLAIVSSAYASHGFTWWQSGSTWANFGRTCLIAGGMASITLASYRLFHVPFLAVLKKHSPDR